MEEVLSLKWENHCHTFLEILGVIRQQQMYSDVTLACSGKFYNVHKLILAGCSDYFKEIIDQTDCRKPVIVLHGIKYKDLEGLLDFMYMGEVRVKQIDLTSLIHAAECLLIKGFSVVNCESLKKSEIEIPSGNPSQLSGSLKKRKFINDNESHLTELPNAKSAKINETHYQCLNIVDTKEDKQSVWEVSSELVKVEMEDDYLYVKPSNLEDDHSAENMKAEPSIEGLQQCSKLPSESNSESSIDVNSFQTNDDLQKMSPSCHWMDGVDDINESSSDERFPSGGDISAMGRGLEEEPASQKITFKKGNARTVFREKQKTLRQSGHSYINSRGIHKPAIIFKSNYKCSCRLKCSEKLTSEVLEKFHQYYWNLKDWACQSNFIRQTVKQSCTSRKTTGSNSSRRQCTMKYFLNEIRVCKKTYLNTLCIGSNRVHYCLTRKSQNCFDLRGKRQKNKIM